MALSGAFSLALVLVGPSSCRQAGSQSKRAETRSKVCACDFSGRLVVAMSGASLSRSFWWVHHPCRQAASQSDGAETRAKFVHVTFLAGWSWLKVVPSLSRWSLWVRYSVGRQTAGLKEPKLEANFLAGWSWH